MMEELIKAIERDDLETAWDLMDSGIDNNRAVGMAAYYGRTTIVELLLERKADPTADNNYAIVVASGNGHNDAVQLLINARADTSADGNQALFDAVENGHTDVIETLIDAGADPSSNDNDIIKWTAHNADIVRLLINDTHSRYRYALDQSTLYIFYLADDGEVNIPDSVEKYGCHIWCSKPDEINCEFIMGYINNIKLSKSVQIYF
jgi:ankyrin repeat protein